VSPDNRTTPRSGHPDTAVGWHSAGAEAFDAAYANHRRFRDRHRVWLDVIERDSDTTREALDLGCGSGELLLPLARRNRRVIGIDGSAEMLRLCEQKLARAGLSNTTLYQADIADLSGLALGPFDLIIASSVLEYVPDLDSVLAAIAGLLRPHGIFLLSVPNASSLYRRAEPLIYRLLRWPTYYRYMINIATRPEMQRRLEASGFRLLETRFMVPTPVLSAVLRPLGLRALADNLVLYSCERLP
jgi:2-polyprenyl-6-hydroxyphenyl methylase/3-demethylubiquinone-9 3-methyltransferase